MDEQTVPSTVSINVDKEGKYNDGLGHAFSLKKGSNEVSAELAKLLVAEYPDTISSSGVSPASEQTEDDAILS